ncbi:hypothetical protein K438DRAFT_1857006 [Mycena galopus ATCC 62051]|nr:hypothetical protein K438DRAFT_1857006 [Mycena galopus ATCC 62051]
MPHSSVNHPCALCGRAAFLWSQCSCCQTTWYCSPDHMSALWPHISVDAILFSADEDRPRIVTVKCRPPQRPSHGVCPLLFLQPYFDAQPDNDVLSQNLNGEPLRFPLHIIYSSTALARASPINRSIYHITSGAASKPWYGNVIVLKFNGARRQGYTDAGSNDLPALSAYFLSNQ